MREHAIHGFRNRDIRLQLYPFPSAPAKNLGARVSRILKRLHVRNLIAKIPRSHRWRVTRLGHDLLAAALHVRDAHFVQALTQPAPAQIPPTRLEIFASCGDVPEKDSICRAAGVRIDDPW